MVDRESDPSQYPAVGVGPAQLDSHQRLLAAGRDRADSPQFGGEAPDRLECGTSNRHRGTDRVTDLAAVGRDSAIVASDHPAELTGKPPRGPTVPRGVDATADRHGRGIGERDPYLVEPARSDDRVVVEEDEHVLGGVGQSGVARAGQTSLTCVVHHDDLIGRNAYRPLFVDVVEESPAQSRIVVDHDEQPIGRRELSRHRVNAASGHRPPVGRVAADHRADRDRAGSSGTVYTGGRTGHRPSPLNVQRNLGHLEKPQLGKARLT